MVAVAIEDSVYFHTSLADGEEVVLVSFFNFAFFAYELYLMLAQSVLLVRVEMVRDIFLVENRLRVEEDGPVFKRSLRLFLRIVVEPARR